MMEDKGVLCHALSQPLTVFHTRAELGLTFDRYAVFFFLFLFLVISWGYTTIF